MTATDYSKSEDVAEDRFEIAGRRDTYLLEDTDPVAKVELQPAEGIERSGPPRRANEGDAGDEIGDP